MTRIYADSAAHETVLPGRLISVDAEIVSDHRPSDEIFEYLAMLQNADLDALRHFRESREIEGEFHYNGSKLRVNSATFELKGDLDFLAGTYSIGKGSFLDLRRNGNWLNPTVETTLSISYQSVDRGGMIIRNMLPAILRDHNSPARLSRVSAKREGVQVNFDDSLDEIVERIDERLDETGMLTHRGVTYEVVSADYEIERIPEINRYVEVTRPLFLLFKNTAGENEAHFKVRQRLSRGNLNKQEEVPED